MYVYVIILFAHVMQHMTLHADRGAGCASMCASVLLLVIIGTDWYVLGYSCKPQ